MPAFTTNLSVDNTQHSFISLSTEKEHTVKLSRDMSRLLCEAITYLVINLRWEFTRTFDKSCMVFWPAGSPSVVTEYLLLQCEYILPGQIHVVLCCKPAPAAKSTQQ